jgi:outer membrane protein assembly factor BamB
VRVVGVHRGAFIINSYVKKGYEVEGYAISARTPTKTLWTFRTPKDSLSIDNKISVAENGTIFIPILVNPSNARRGYELTALDAKTGKVMWVWKTSAEPETLVEGNRVYASIYSEDRAGKKAAWIKAFDLQTGRELWTHQMLGGMALLANDREVFIHDRAAESKSRLVVVDSQK